MLLLILATARPTPTTALPESVEVVERGAPNTLTSAEVAAGWQLLWDGVSGEGWRAAGGKTFPEHGWSIQDGVLTIRAARFYEFRAGGDLFSEARFGDFVLDFDFRLTEGANSGVKYLAEPQKQMGFVHSLGCEYQLLDDARHPDAKAGRDGNRGLGGLYDMIPPEPRPARGVGAWQHGRIHLEKGQLAHYLDGVRIVSVEIDSPAWQSALAGSKFADRSGYCAGPDGHIVLQDHGNEVRFRNLRILPLDAEPGES